MKRRTEKTTPKERPREERIRREERQWSHCELVRQYMARGVERNEEEE